MAALRRTCARLPKEIGSAESEARAARERIEAAQRELGDTEAERRAREAEIEDTRAQRVKLEGQTALVKTNEEYHALLREIDGAGERVSTLEDDVLELMERIEQLGVRAAEVDKEQTAVEAGLLARVEELRGEQARAEERVVEVTRERDAVNLRSYQAMKPYFPLAFRSGKDPLYRMSRTRDPAGILQHPMSASPARAWTSFSSSIAPLPFASTNASLQAHTEQVLGLDGELHREFPEHLLAESIDDHVDRVLFRESALHAVEELVFADLRSGGLVLDLSRGVLHFEVGEGVRTTPACS